MKAWCDCTENFTTTVEVGSKQHKISGIRYYVCSECKRTIKLTEANAY